MSDDKARRQANRARVKAVFAERLNEQLTIRQESISAFAKRSGVPLGTVWSIAHQKHSPSAVVLWRIARTLGVSADALVR